MCPAWRIAKALAIRFETLHYLESHGQGTMLPRLVGFSTERDRSFFELFTTVKNIGYRKALQALQLPFDEVADAIAAKDVQRLDQPAGDRQANGRDDHRRTPRQGGPVSRRHPAQPVAAVPAAQRTLAGDTIFMLTALGESPAEAKRYVEQAITANPEINEPEDLLAAVYQLKETVS